MALRQLVEAAFFLSHFSQKQKKPTQRAGFNKFAKIRLFLLFLHGKVGNSCNYNNNNHNNNYGCA